MVHSEQAWFPFVYSVSTVQVETCSVDEGRPGMNCTQYARFPGASRFIRLACNIRDANFARRKVRVRIESQNSRRYERSILLLALIGITCEIWWSISWELEPTCFWDMDIDLRAICVHCKSALAYRRIEFSDFHFACVKQEGTYCTWIGRLKKKNERKSPSFLKNRWKTYKMLSEDIYNVL